MTLDPGPLADFGRIADVGSALLFLALGILVAFMAPRRRVNLAFAVFAIGFGVAWTLSNLQSVPVAIGNHAILVLSPIATLGLIVVALEFPTRLQERRWLWFAFGLGAVAMTVSVALAARESYLGASAVESEAIRLVTMLLFHLGFGSFLLLLGLRFRATPPGRQRTLTLMATWAFLPYYAVAAGLYGVMHIVHVNGPHSAWGYAAAPGTLFVLLALICLWLRNASVLPGTDARVARRVAWGAAALAAAGAGFASLFGTQALPNNLGPLGLARAFGVVLLAYAILKHELFDIEVKLRFAVKGSTLAAVFVGVFFVVSETAQAFFGERANNEYYGIAAAGALVFAIAPLQRMAERMALRAVPGPTANAPADFYRQQVELAWMDGAITRREVLILDNLRGHLGLDEATARRIETEAMARHGPHTPARRPAARSPGGRRKDFP